MKEEIKIGLLAVIAGTLIIQTYLTWNEGGHGSQPDPLVSGQSTNTANQPATEINPAVNTPPKPELPKTSIQFTEEVFDFGKIKQETENKHLFNFRNAGANPLVIENAHGSCGCTVPTWPKDPIQPGGTGEIEVVYKPGKQQGSQTKTVTVLANTEPKETKVTIKAEIEVVQ